MADRVVVSCRVVRRWWSFGALLVIAYFLVDGLLADLVYEAVGGAVVVAIVVGVRRQGLARAPWHLIAAAQGAWILGDALSTFGEHVLHTERFLASDVAYLSGYPLLAVGLVRLVRLRAPGHDRSSLIDGSILACGMAVVLWVYVMAPYANVADVSIRDRVVSLAYPIGDVVLLAVAARLAAARGGRPPAFWWLAVFLGCTLAGDAISLVLSLSDSYQPGGPIDALWLVGYLALGAAVLHPSARVLEAAAVKLDERLSWRRLVGLGGASLIAPGVLAVQAARGKSLELLVVINGTMLLFVLVVARMWQLVKALERSKEQLRQDALHDPLTGLANRVMLSHKLTQMLARPAGAKPRAALVYVDLDDFKMVNDTLGHAAGDQLLVTVGQRLSASLRANDLAARVGGDEFVVLLEVPDADAVGGVTDRLVEVLEAPVALADRLHQVRASVGVVIDRADVIDAEDMLARADAAMYVAKRGGKGRIVVDDASGFGASSASRAASSTSCAAPSS